VHEVWGVKVENGENIPYIVEQVKQLVLVDLGKTVRTTVAPEGTPVTAIFANAIPYSFAFGSLSVIVSFLVGIPLGIEAAKRKGKSTDTLINGFNLFIAAVPALIITLGIYILAIMGFGTSSLFSTGSF
jgi:oligopeptide transport system permease protein